MGTIFLGYYPIAVKMKRSFYNTLKSSSHNDRLLIFYQYKQILNGKYQLLGIQCVLLENPVCIGFLVILTWKGPKN